MLYNNILCIPGSSFSLNDINSVDPCVFEHKFNIKKIDQSGVRTHILYVYTRTLALK